jgi:hypothetical protein
MAIIAVISMPAFAQQPNQGQASGKMAEATSKVESMTDIAKVSQVLARYVRGADRRDSEAIARLFVENAVVETRWYNSGNPHREMRIEGREKIKLAVSKIPPPVALGNSHHASMDHIVSINGDRAALDAQFVLFRSVAIARPETGWPAGTSGNQGTIKPDNAGYYRLKLVRVDGEWLITEMIIDHDLPFVPRGNH